MSKETSVDYLLSRIAQYPLLTPSQELELGRQVQAGRESSDQRVLRIAKRAKDKLIKCNLRLAFFVAKKYTHRCDHLELADLFQYGCFGLNRGAELYNPASGYKFATYAYWWIRQAITRGIVDADHMVRLPQHQSENLASVKRARADLGADAPLSQILETAKVSRAQYKNLMEAPLKVLSLNYRPGNHGNDIAPELLDMIPERKQHSNIDNDVIDIIQDYIEKLPTEQSRNIVKRYYGIGRTKSENLTTIAKDYKLSRERIRQIRDQAHNQIRLMMAYDGNAVLAEGLG
jgi:RNA polymerase primary sigma factor